MKKLTREQFFAAIAPAVLHIRQEGSFMYSSVRLAQSLLETGGVIHPWNNLGGIAKRCDMGACEKYRRIIRRSNRLDWQ